MQKKFKFYFIAMNHCKGDHCISRLHEGVLLLLKKARFFLSRYAWFTTLDVDQELCFILASFNNITRLSFFPTCITGVYSPKNYFYCYWNLCELWELSFMQWIFRKNNIISVHTCKPDKRIYNLQLRCFWYPSHW